MTMQQRSTPTSFRISTLYVPDSLVSHSQLPDEDLDLLIQEVLSFMRSSEWLKRKDLHIFSLKTCRGYSITAKGKPSPRSSVRYQSWGMWRNFPVIFQASKRLQTVVVENKDFERLLAQYDRPNTMFYLDPPYYATEDYYEDVGFTSEDHKRLCDALMGIKGKFLLSYNDCPEIRQLYCKTGIMIESTTRLNNIAQRFDAGSQYPELFISNYNTYEEGLLSVRQLDLFEDREQTEKLLRERKIIWKETVN